MKRRNEVLKDLDQKEVLSIKERHLKDAIANLFNN